MAPISTISGPNESQRCQLKFDNFLDRRTKIRDGENFEKLSKSLKKLSRAPFRAKNKIETAISFVLFVHPLMSCGAEKNHLIEAALFGRLDQMLWMTV